MFQQPTSQFPHTVCTCMMYVRVIFSSQKLYICKCVSEYLSIYVLSCIHVMNVYRLECMCKVLNARLHCSWWYSCMPITRNEAHTAPNTRFIQQRTLLASPPRPARIPTSQLFKPPPILSSPHIRTQPLDSTSPPCTALSPIFKLPIFKLLLCLKKVVFMDS